MQALSCASPCDNGALQSVPFSNLEGYAVDVTCPFARSAKTSAFGDFRINLMFTLDSVVHESSISKI